MSQAGQDQEKCECGGKFYEHNPRCSGYHATYAGMVGCSCEGFTPAIQPTKIEHIWKGVIDKYEGKTGPSLIGPDGNIWFETLGDAQLAASECNHAHHRALQSRDEGWENLKCKVMGDLTEARALGGDADRITHMKKVLQWMIDIELK